MASLEIPIPEPQLKHIRSIFQHMKLGGSRQVEIGKYNLLDKLFDLVILAKNYVFGLIPTTWEEYKFIHTPTVPAQGQVEPIF